MGAPESNAGDDFHFWWAASRALALIAPGTDSCLLTIEGLSAVDDPDEDYQAVDVAEYVGGDNLESASVVVVSQLKYSTRHPNKAWTVSRICERRTRRADAGAALSTRSVIADLADTYARLLVSHQRDQLLPKLRISLVSNQPGDELLQESVAAAAEWVRSRPTMTQKATLMKAITEPQVSVISRLAEAIGTRLKSGEFCDFLTVLDLSETGTLERAALARSVRSRAADLTFGRGPDSARSLFDLVRREALPESSRGGICAADVLAELGVAHVLDLYPAPTRLPSIPDPLPAPGSHAVAEAVLARSGGVVVAHGPAGAGKTTALQQLETQLPPGSVVALFDCYGGGEYLSSGEERHTPQRFVTQMVNHLAQQCGTPLLVYPPAVEEDLWRRLTHTLSAAVDALDRDAALVMAVDAADNAVYAASERGQRGFLPGLVALPLPPGVTVVLTARSHRVPSLAAAGATEVELLPFDPPTSAAHLRRYRPTVSQAEATDFHEKTGGNPRVQFYLLTQAETEDWDMPSLLAKCVNTPEPLFAELVDSALQVCSPAAGGERWLALMLALARPISTAKLALALEVDPTAVVAFAHGLTPGVELVDEKIQFRDENFETYVRERVDPADVVAAHGRLANIFLASRAGDADAAAHVADHLFSAGRLDDLLALVLGEQSPTAIPDGFRRVEVQGRRLDLAAQASASTGSASGAVRLAVRGCETASGRDMLSSLAESHLEVVARYADVDLLRSHAVRQSRDQWLAPVHMRLAAVLARDPDRHPAAREALESAEAWLRRWTNGPKEETQHWDIDHKDVAYAAEARFWLDGMDGAIGELRRWQPDEFVLDAAAELAARVAGALHPDTLRDALRAQGLPVLAQAPFLAHAASQQSAPARDWVDEVVTAALAANLGEAELWHGRLVEVVARHGSRESAAALAMHWAPDLPAHPWAFDSGDAAGVAALRIRAIAAVLQGAELAVEDLAPSSLREPRVAGDSYERRRWTETVKPLLAATLLAARAAMGCTSADEVSAFVEAGLADRTAAAEHRWFKFDRSYSAWATIAVDYAVDGDAAPVVIDRLADAAPLLLPGRAPGLWLELASALSRRSAYPDRVADLCARAAKQAVTDAYSAADRLDLLARAAAITADVEPKLGSRLFNQAVDAVSTLNDDAARLLALHSDLAERSEVSDQDRRSMATQLILAAEAAAQFVTEADAIPYAVLLRAAARLDAGVALAAASRWDDEDRIHLASTLPAALCGAVNGGGISLTVALALDHLIDEDGSRFQYQLALHDLLPPSAASAATIRRALQRAADWLRRDVPARTQSAFAQRLLDWAAARGFDGPIRPLLDPVARLRSDDADTRRWRGSDLPEEAQSLLHHRQARTWETLADDVAVLAGARVYGQDMRDFIRSVVLAAPPEERVEALAAVAALPSGLGGDADTVLPVLADCIARWAHWPGVAEWARSALPSLLSRHLQHLAWRQDIATLHHQLRAFDDDDGIRRALLLALPDARPRLSAFGWQNVARLLGQLCDADEAANALTALLAERLAHSDARSDILRPTDPGDPIPLLLWSVFGHPRRAMRWRAAHAVRELLLQLEPLSARELATALVACLDRTDAGPFRSPTLHFYKMSAAAALFVALQRIAVESPAVVTDRLSDFVRHATRRDFPHAQIRELARQTALALAHPADSVIEPIRHANQPVACSIDRTFRDHSDDRRLSEKRRYDFDWVDTLPYWYAPLARVFDLPLDHFADRAERWIIDEWGLGKEDWMNDARELRDQRSYERMSHRHGSIPPEENLHLYLEYHAMMVVAGELVDQRLPIRFDYYDATDDPWWRWLRSHLPESWATWLADLRRPVPAEPDLFGHLSPLDEWGSASDGEYDAALQLVDGRLPDPVLVAGHTHLSRQGGYGTTYIRSALVVADRASALQRALSAAVNPTDWKLPDEDDAEFEVNHDGFVLRGWLADPTHARGGLDEHDPYAKGLSLALPMPGRCFREETGAILDSTGCTLRAPDGTVIANSEQWADRDDDKEFEVTSSGNRVYVARGPLLQYLAAMASTLIVEVQIGRHRRSAEFGEYRPPRTRIYLVDATGRVTVR